MNVEEKIALLEKNNNSVPINEAAKKASKNEIIYNIVQNTPIIYLSGKFFNKETKEEIKDYEKYIQRIGVQEFKCPFNETDFKYFIECIRVKEDSNDKGNWPTLPLWKEAMIMYQENPAPRNPLAFELTVEQYTMIYYMIYQQDAEIMFITTGRAKSGKSTYLNIVRQLFDNDYSSATLSEVTSNEFARATAINHRLICSDEINADDIDTGVLKTLISHQPTLLNAKNQKPVEIKSQSTLFYCCNKEPRIDITDTGIMRRIKFYRRDKRIEHPNKKLQSKEYTREELLDFLIMAQLVHDKFEEKEKDPLEIFDIDTGHYLFQNNSIFRFFYKCNRPVNFISNVWEADEEYKLYRDWCTGSGYRPYNEQNYEIIKEELFKVLQKQTMESIATKYVD